MRLVDDDEEKVIIRKGMIVRPVVFFSDWLGLVLTDPMQYEPTDAESDMLIYAPQQNPHPHYWDGILVVDVYWFTEGERTEEFIDFLEIVLPPQDDLDDPDYIKNKYDFDWTRGDE